MDNKKRGFGSFGNNKANTGKQSFTKTKTFNANAKTNESQTQQKKSRPNDDNNDDDFDDTMDEDMDFMSQEMPDEDMDALDENFSAPESLETHTRWCRPKRGDVDPDADAIVFQQIDIDSYIGPIRPGMPGP
ncbi:unnamed protein product, partial [Medioppia subpectinata]